MKDEGGGLRMAGKQTVRRSWSFADKGLSKLELGNEGGPGEVQLRGVGGVPKYNLGTREGNSPQDRRALEFSGLRTRRWKVLRLVGFAYLADSVHSLRRTERWGAKM